MIRLKELREERNWSMVEAAKYLNKPYMTYVHHEKGSREPNSEDLVAYAKFYGVSIDYLVGRTNEKTATYNGDGDSSDLLTDYDKRFMAWFRSLPPEKRKAILIAQDAPEDLL